VYLWCAMRRGGGGWEGKEGGGDNKKENNGGAKGRKMKEKGILTGKGRLSSGMMWCDDG
jgi:hypothetical protein